MTQRNDVRRSGGEQGCSSPMFSSGCCLASDSDRTGTYTIARDKVFAFDFETGQRCPIQGPAT